MFKDHHLAKPIDESRFEDAIYSHLEFRHFSKYKLGTYANRHLIYFENENKITLITKEKSEWTTDLECDVCDYETSTFYKSVEALRNAVQTAWDKHINTAIQERDAALNRFDNQFN